MVKAKGFLEYLCGKLEYRFFSGVVCPGFIPLYKKMSSDIMHYVPAVNERVALGLVSGAYVGGFKGVLLMDMRFVSDIQRLLHFNYDYKIPLFILGYGKSDLCFDIPFIKFKKLEDLTKADVIYEEELSPVLVNIEEGVLS